MENLQSKDKATDNPDIKKNPPVETGAWTPGSTVDKQKQTDALPPGFPQNLTIDGLNTSPSSPGDKATSAPNEKPSDKPKSTFTNFDAKKEASSINDALHPGFFSLGADGQKVFNQMLNMSPQEFKQVSDAFNKDFAAADKPWLASSAKPWTLADDVKQNLSSSDADRVGKLMDSKAQNDVPPEHQISGDQLLKPGSNLKVGEINDVTLPDGRRYGVYVPKNADDRAPVIVAMHGAAPGTSEGLMAQESGLTADAERTGSTVVFAYPKPRDFAVGPTSLNGVAWNAPDRTNLPAKPDSTDDEKYLDNVLNDLSSKAQTNPKVGLMGFSDGGRFAQVYAADKPDRVAAVVSEDGTWMKGDKEPTSGKPIMIMHGTNDQTLPYNGGLGSVSNIMDMALGTNLDKSAPYMQAQVWGAADQCTGPVQTKTTGDITTNTYTDCKVGSVQEMLLKNGQHAINDYKNQGNWFMQSLLGSPNRQKDFATIGAEFLTSNIVAGT